MLIEKLRQSLKYIRSKTQITPRVGVVLGSGFAGFADQVRVESVINCKDVPYMPVPRVESHVAELAVGHVGDTPVAVLRGRVHFYEGYSMPEVTYAARLLCFWGAKKLLLTNAAGGVEPTMAPGDFMLLTDHINYMGTNPLIGPNEAELGPRFVDVSALYSRALREGFAKILRKHNIRHHQGVYCAYMGPSYETAAEIQAFKRLGASAVGMSTAPEALVGAHMGAEVCGISCISNPATGTAAPGESINHEEVFEKCKTACKALHPVMGEFVKSL